MKRVNRSALIRRQATRSVIQWGSAEITSTPFDQSSASSACATDSRSSSGLTGIAKHANTSCFNAVMMSPAVSSGAITTVRMPGW